MKIELWKTDWQKGGWVTDNVSTVKACEANLNEYNRAKFVTDCVAISRGQTESKNPEKRFKHLLTEAAPNYCDNTCTGVAGKPLEFLPVVIDGNNLRHKEVVNCILSQDSLLKIFKFSYITEKKPDTIYTNMRALLNAGIPYEMIPYNTAEELKDFKVVKVKAPYFTFAQIRTHGQLSQVAASGRVIVEDELWLPVDIEDRIKKGNYKYKINDLLNWKNVTAGKYEEILKTLNYKKEIYQRYPNQALYKQWVMAGWLCNPLMWEHFLLERGAYPEKYKNWVQPTTQETAIAIKQVIKGD